jgi:putative transposase
MDSLRWVWNHGLELIQEVDSFTYWDKHTKTLVPCCPLPWEYRWFKDGDSWVAAPYSSITARGKQYRSVCPIPQAHREPRLRKVSAFELAAYFAHKRHPDKEWLTQVPSGFIRGITQSLVVAWDKYKKGERKAPRFKSKTNGYKTITHDDPKKLALDGNYLKIPRIGKVKVRGLLKRWGETEIRALRICKRPSGWYLQLVGEVSNTLCKPSTKAVGVAFSGSGLHHATDRKKVKAPGFLNRQQKRLARLQRKQARQQPGSSNQQKTKRRIGKLHERVRLQRRNFNHKLSTYMVRAFGLIAIQKTWHGPKRRPEPKVVGGEYVPNGATLRAIENRYRADLGVGQFVGFIKQKALLAGRELIEVPASDSSLQGQELASSIRSEALVAFGGVYGVCAPEVMPVKGSPRESVQQESGKPEHRSEATAATSSKKTASRKQTNKQKAQEPYPEEGAPSGTNLSAQLDKGHQRTQKRAQPLEEEDNAAQYITEYYEGFQFYEGQ